MDPQGIAPPRLRVALLAAMAALAAMAIASPGAASAADHSVSLSCAPATVDAGETANCEAIVSSNGSAPIATGHFVYEIAGKTEYFDLGSQLCDLQPVSATAASCSFPVTGYAAGGETVSAYYPPGPLGEAESDSFDITVKGGTMPVSCDDPVFVSAEPNICRVFVPAPPGAAPASGSVEFSSITRRNFLPQGEVEPECELEPVAGGARCSVVFTVPMFGDYAVLGRYDGDGTYAPDRGTAFATAVENHKTDVLTLCERQFPLILMQIECTTTVTSLFPPSGPAPSGKVQFGTTHPGTFPGPKDDDCEVEPIAPRKAACSVIYRPDDLGFQVVTGEYSHPESLFEGGKGFFLLDVREGRLTATSLACEPGKLGVFRKCIATVRDAESKPPAAPVGTVTFSGKAEFSLNPCKPLAVPGMTGVSRCEVGYRPSAQGTLTLRAEYEDTGSSHYPSAAVTSVFVQPPFQGPRADLYTD